MGIVQCGAQLGDLKALLLWDISVGREIPVKPFIDHVKHEHLVDQF